MNFKTVALLHPGNMGVTIGAAAAARGWDNHQHGAENPFYAGNPLAPCRRFSPGVGDPISYRTQGIVQRQAFISLRRYAEHT